MASCVATQPTLFRFRRNDHLNSVLDSFNELRYNEALLDCSIVCEGKVLRAHKLLLAASSDYFRAAFLSLNNPPCQSTAVIIKDMPFDDLKTIVDFIYRGEITVDQIAVPSLIRSAEALSVSGLRADNATLSSGGQAPTSAINLQKLLPAHMVDDQKRSPLPRPSSNGSKPAADVPNGQPAPSSLLSSDRIDSANQHLSLQQSRLDCSSPYLNCDDYSSSDEIDIPHHPRTHRESKSPEPDFERPSTPMSDGDEAYRIVIEDEGADAGGSNGGMVAAANADDDDSSQTRAETDKVIDLSSGSEASAYEHKKLKIALKLHHQDPSSQQQLQQKPMSSGQQSPAGSGGGGSQYTAPVARTNQMAFPRNLSNLTSDSPMSRAMAAAVSNILASQQQQQQQSHLSNSHHTKENHAASSMSLDPYSQYLFSDNNSTYKVRGRGRPPRYSFDDDPKVKSYKIRPILPTTSAPFLMPGGGMLSLAPDDLHPYKRTKLTTEPYLARGRKPKLGNMPPSREVNGKNKCPHCPQVYYSTQAMNDHINNVHSMNAQKYVCKICAKEFSWKISLNKHYRKVHDEPLEQSNSVAAAPLATPMSSLGGKSQSPLMLAMSEGSAGIVGLPTTC